MSRGRILPNFARAITGELREVAIATPDISNVSNILIKFSPWNENSVSTKFVWRQLYDEKCRETNRFCKYKTVVDHNNDEPLVELTFNDGEKLRLIGTYLKPIEMMYYINSFCIKKVDITEDKPKVLF